jgi:hypothetical protein
MRASSPTNNGSPTYNNPAAMSQYQSKFQTRSSSPQTVQIQNLTSHITQGPPPTPTSPAQQQQQQIPQQNVNIHNYQGFPTPFNTNVAVMPNSPYQVRIYWLFIVTPTGFFCASVVSTTRQYYIS